jgi:dipeptidyl aminopeptidase/acylaminoacyl peptidase
VRYRPLADFRPGERLAAVPHTTRRFACRSALAISPDARQIAFISDQGSGTFEAFSVSVTGGTPVRVLELEGGAIRSLCWSPGGELIGAADRGGTEMHQLYVRHPDGPVAPLSVDPAGRVQRLLSSNARTPTDMDIVIVDASGAGERTLVSGPAWHVAGGWSPTGSELLVMRVLDNTTQDLLVVDVGSGSAREITRHREDVQHVPAGWLADGHIAMITDEDSEHLYLADLDIRTGAIERIDAPDWDVELAVSSHDGRVQVWSVNEDGYSKLRWRRDRNIRTLDARCVCFDLIISADGSIVAFSRNGVAGVWEVCVLDTRSGDVRVVATTSRPFPAEEGGVEPEVLRIPAADGPIPCFVYRPRGAQGPTPAILSPHGGPEAQSRPGLFPVHEALLTRGVAIVVPNIHGSTGYGRSWQTAIHKDWGGIDLRDLTAVADWMAAQPDFDRERLAVHGGSYGGFATLMCVTRMPDRWRCGVDVCGWGDLVLALQTKEPNWKRFMERWVGQLPDDEEKLRLRSPITYIQNVRCPMLILQGEKDTRVAKVASDQVVAGLRAAGTPVEYIVYPDEGHGFTKKENADDAQERVLAFLTKHLLESES